MTLKQLHLTSPCRERGSIVYHRLCGEGREGKASVGAVMRKQLTVMHAVLISGKP